MIRLSLSSVFMLDRPLAEMLRAAAEAGYRRLELVCLGEGKHVDLRQWDATRLRGAVEAHGVELVALYTNPIDIHREDRFHASLEYIKHAIDAAAEVPCRHIVFSPLMPREGYDYGRLAQGCLELAEHIGERDVLVCLENHHLWPLSYAGDYARLFAEVSDARIGITMDTGHFTSSGADMSAFIDQFGDRVRHLHLKERRGLEAVPFGEGETDNPGVIEQLRAVGYDGYASVELEQMPPDEIPGQLVQSRRYGHSVLGLD